jgi:chemotaxis protein methyltransferase CheR
MVLSEAARQRPGWRFRILATDVCREVLDRVLRAIYTEECIEPAPMPLRVTYFLQSRDRARGLVRVVPALRSSVCFRRLNLMDDDYGVREPLDVIFSRNVFIYFDRKTQEQVLNRSCRYLLPGRYVFLGHAEVINGLDVPLQPTASTTYRVISGE